MPSYPYPKEKGPRGGQEAVLSLLPRKEALERNSALGRISYPANWPPKSTSVLTSK